MQPATYTGPAGIDEFALAFDLGRPMRLLVIPALFDEANKMRRFTVSIMRMLDAAGIDTILPDLPGCHESLSPLAQQDIESWRDATTSAAVGFAATHVLTIRAGAILAPADLPGWRYAPTAGSNMLRGLLRARSISAREAGLEEKTEDILAKGRTFGMELAGYRLGPSMVQDLEASHLPDHGRQADIAQTDIGGPGLWLRAEPDHNPVQAEAVAAWVSIGMAQ